MYREWINKALLEEKTRCQGAFFAGVYKDFHTPWAWIPKFFKTGRQFPLAKQDDDSLPPTCAKTTFLINWIRLLIMFFCIINKILNGKAVSKAYRQRPHGYSMVKDDKMIEETHDRE